MQRFIGYLIDVLLAVLIAVLVKPLLGGLRFAHQQIHRWLTELEKEDDE